MTENSIEDAPGEDPQESYSDRTDPELRFTNAPNILTLFRIALIPVLVTCLFFREPKWDLIAGIIFGVASITDYFDGYLARIQKSVTLYGKLMDPLADKFLVVSALVMLQYLDRIHPAIVILLICREIAITGLRALASAEGVDIPASWTAKWKTGTQMVAIPFMMVKQGLWGIPLYPIGKILLYISLLISLWSALMYLLDFFREVTKKRKLAKEMRAKIRKEKRMKKAFQSGP